MRSLLFLSVLALNALVLRADVIEQGPKDSPPSGLLAGTARADITPPVGIAQMNWGSQTHVVATGVDPAGMWATALVVSDGKQKFVMVDLDAGSVAPFRDAIGRAAAAIGVPPDHVRLAAFHTHAGPSITPGKGPVGVDLTEYQRVMDRYRAAVSDKIAGVVAEANSRLRPVHVGGGKGSGTVNINRRVRADGDKPAAVGRNPGGFVDRELPVIRMDDAQGHPYAVIANFPCHGTVLAYENKIVSPDWVGMTRKVVEAALPGAICLFFQGAAGNQGPIEGFTGDLSVAHRLGSILGHEIAAVALSIETVQREPRFEGFVESSAYQAKQPWRVARPRDGTLKFVKRVLELPPRAYSQKEISDMEALVADAKAKVAESQSRGDLWAKHQAEARLRRFTDLLTAWKRPFDPTPAAVEVEILRIGESAIVAMPGEPFAEIGLAIKKASPFPTTLFCGYSSGRGGGYIPVESEYAFGGYEIQITPYGVGAAEKLIRETANLFEQVR